MTKLRFERTVTVGVLGLAAALVAADLSPPASAETTHWQAAAQANPFLIHQYTFDGDDEWERRADKVGTADLAVITNGSGLPDDIGYGVAGYDATSDAASTFRLVPGSDHEGGAAFQATGVALGNEMSYEIVFQPYQAEMTGGAWNLGYILANRDGGNRGYFLLQGSSESSGGTFGIDGSDLADIIGSSFATDNEQTILETVQAEHWYYAAGAYTVASDGSTTTFTNYIADLTAGDTTLTEVGPFTSTGTYATGSSTLGIGQRWDAGETFPGTIDEVNLYNLAFDGDLFQTHLEQLLISEPPNCDFDLNEACTVDDIDLLMYDGLVNGGTQFDLDANGSVDAADVDEWLSIAGEMNISVTYVKGDTDLDGDVDAADLNNLGQNWQSTAATSWGQGDFDGNSTVDAGDLNSIGVNWQHGVPAQASAVPEPSGICLAATALLVACLRRRRQNRSATCAFLG